MEKENYIMALPRLNELPKYDIVIPSTGEQTTFRPYLVKEEKLLLMAAETGDEKTVANATVELIKSCIDTPLDNKNLASFDIEYLFCKIRAKSVGETSKLLLMCQNNDCEY